MCIGLEPTLGPTENMQRYFRRSRRLLRGRPLVEERLQQAAGELSRIEAQLTQLEEIQDDAEALSALQKKPDV